MELNLTSCLRFQKSPLILKLYLLATIACIIATFIYLAFKHYTNFFFLIVIQILIYFIINSLKYRITRNLRNECQGQGIQNQDEEYGANLNQENALNSGSTSNTRISQNMDETSASFESSAPCEDNQLTVNGPGWNFKPPSYDEPPSYEEFTNLKK